MKPSELFFYAMPVWLSVGFFTLIAAINFDYEWKFFQSTGLIDPALGLKMLGVAAVASIASGVFLFIMRRNFVGRQNRSNVVGRWLHIVLPGLVAFVLCMAAVLIVVLGPAALTMLQQLRS